jgi:hypothetical protein
MSNLDSEMDGFYIEIFLMELLQIFKMKSSTTFKLCSRHKFT